MRALLVGLVLLVASPALADHCVVKFDCKGREASINGKVYPIICGRLTGQNGDGAVGSLIRANGRWRPGLVAPGTPMITTSPRLCDDCFIHVSYTGRGATSNGCLGISAAGFSALKACAGSPFQIAR